MSACVCEASNYLDASLITMEFLDAAGQVIFSYPTKLPSHYDEVRCKMQECLESHQDRLRSVSRIICVTGWMYLYLNDTDETLSDLIISNLPDECEKVVSLQRPDVSGWDMPQSDWDEYCSWNLNNVTIVGS